MADRDENRAKREAKAKEEYEQWQELSKAHWSHWRAWGSWFSWGSTSWAWAVLRTRGSCCRCADLGY